MTIVINVVPELRAFFDQVSSTYLRVPFVAETTGGLEPHERIRDQDLETGILSPTRPRHAVQMTIGDEPATLFQVAGAAIRSIPWLEIQLKEWFDHDFDQDRQIGPNLIERVELCMPEVTTLNMDAKGMSDTISGVPALKPGTMLDFVHWVIDNVVTPMFVLVVLKDSHPFPGTTLSAEGLYFSREHELSSARAAHGRRRHDGPHIM